MRALREGTDGRRVGAGDLRILWLDRGGAADLLRIGRLACESRDGGASDRGRSPVEQRRCRQAMRGGGGGREGHRRDVPATFHLSHGVLNTAAARGDRKSDMEGKRWEAQMDG